jgi:hypothetical protein
MKIYRSIDTKKASMQGFRINLFIYLPRFSTIFHIELLLMISENCIYFSFIFQKYGITDSRQKDIEFIRHIRFLVWI